MGKYQIIYADPPWAHDDKANAGKRGAIHKYRVMSLGQLMAMREYIDSLAAPDCLLAMWWCGPMPEEALLLVKAWGFTLKTMKGFTWHKTTTKGKDAFGMGNWTRCNTEDCLFAVRGRPKRVSASVRQLIVAELREHSRKPDEARNGLVELMGDVPRIELFARQAHPGWDAMGDELPGRATEAEMREALEAWWVTVDAVRRCDAGGNDGADVYEAMEAQKVAVELTEKILFGIPDTRKKNSDLVPPLSEEDGIPVPVPPIYSVYPNPDAKSVGELFPPFVPTNDENPMEDERQVEVGIWLESFDAARAMEMPDGLED